MSPADKISLSRPLFSEHKNLPHFFCQKEEDLLLSFHIMLEGLRQVNVMLQFIVNQSKT